MNAITISTGHLSENPLRTAGWSNIIFDVAFVCGCAIDRYCEVELDTSLDAVSFMRDIDSTGPELLEELKTMGGGKWWEAVDLSQPDKLEKYTSTLCKFIQMVNLKDQLRLEFGLAAALFKIYLLYGMNKLLGLHNEGVDRVVKVMFDDNLLVDLMMYEYADQVSVRDGLMSVNLIGHGSQMGNYSVG